MHDCAAAERESTAFVDYKRLYEELLATCDSQKAAIKKLSSENHRLHRYASPFNNNMHEWFANLQHKVKIQAHQIAAFESGEKYISMKADFNACISERDRKIKQQGKELADANSRLVTMRENWMNVFEDTHKEHEKELRAKDSRINQLFERAIKAEGRSDTLLNENRDLRVELYAVKNELYEEQEKRTRLVIQLKRNHENSSVPSSQKPNGKKIANSREKSDKKPGAQPGHKGHGRKWHEATSIHEIKAPEYEGNPDYKPTGRIIRKQVVNVVFSTVVDELWTLEYRHVRTRSRVHAAFPPGVVNEVNYGGSVKAVAFLLNNDCNVSIDKTKELISELTGGQLEISRGMINGLSKEFSKKTRDGQAAIFSKLLTSDVMGTDYSTAKVNGKQVQVLVCANDESNMFYVRNKKGHEGIKDTPVENFLGTLLHDHDKTFYSYGKLHQECLVHILRYLVSSMENETGLTWNKQMWELIREMIHYRNGLDPDADADPDILKKFEDSYIAILDTADNEYGFELPSKYYRDGYNLSRRLREFKDSHLLFLTDGRVPSNNNLCERLLRKLKRKMRQVMTFRSFESLENFCTALGLLGMIKLKSDNTYARVSEIFS